MHRLQGELRKVRSSIIMLTVSPDITAEELVRLAVDKHCTCNWYLSRTAVYKLLYPDGQLVQTVPGTDEPFTLEKYRQFLGLAYTKVKLFICEENDYIESKHTPLL